MKKVFIYIASYIGITATVATGYVVISPQKVITPTSDQVIVDPSSNQTPPSLPESKSSKFIRNLMQSGNIGLDLDVEIINNEETYKVDFIGTVGYEDLNNIKLDGNVNFDIKGAQIGAEVAFLDSTIYMGTNFMNAKLKVNSFMKGLDELLAKMGITMPDLGSSLPSIDVTSLMGKIMSLNFQNDNGLLKADFALTEDIVLTFYANEDLKLKKVTSSLDVKGMKVNLSADTDLLGKGKHEYICPETEEKVFLDVERFFPIVDNLYQLTKQRQFDLKLNATLTKAGSAPVSLEGKTVFDVNSKNIHGDFDVTVNEKLFEFTTAYYDNEIYFNLLGLFNGRINKDTVATSNMYTDIYEIIKSYTSSDIFEATNSKLSELLNSTIYGDIQKGDWSRIDTFIKSIVLNEEGQFTLVLDPSCLSLGGDRLVISLDNSQTRITRLAINGLQYQDYELSLSVDINEYSELPVINQNDYQDYTPLLTIYDELVALTQQTKYAFALDTTVVNKDKKYTVKGTVQFEVASNTQAPAPTEPTPTEEVSETTGNEQVQEAPAKNSAYVSLTINDQVKDHTLSMDLVDDELFFIYNNKLKGKIKVASIKEIVTMIGELIEAKDPLLSGIAAMMPSATDFGVIGQILNKDYSGLSVDLLNSFSVQEDNLSMEISGAILNSTNDFNIKVNYNDTGLQGVELTGFSVKGISLDGSFNVAEYDENHSVNKDDNYFDLNSLKTLISLGLTTMRQEYYHLTGNVTLTLLSKDMSIPVNVLLHNKNGQVDVHIHLDNIPIIDLINTLPLWLKDSTGEYKMMLTGDSSNRDVDIYISDGFIYLCRTEEVKFQKYVFPKYVSKYETYTRQIKTDLKGFSENMTYYLFEFMLGLGSSITEKIASSMNMLPVEEMQFDSLVNRFEYNADQSQFLFGLNFAALTGKDDIKNAVLTISHDNGEDKHLSGLTLTMDILSVIHINLNASIVDFGQALDMSGLTNFINTYPHEFGVEYVSHKK